MFALLLACSVLPDNQGMDTAHNDQFPYEDEVCEQPEGLAWSTPARPNVMLVVDRSGSMDALACGDSGCMSRWDSVLTLSSYLGDVEAASNLGMPMFSDTSGESCSVRESIVVPVTSDDDAEHWILDELAATSPSGSTPTAAMLHGLVGNERLQDLGRDNVVVLLTDGSPNFARNSNTLECEREAAVEAVEALVSQEVPVKLHIIGFGTDPQAQQTLEQMGAAAQSTTPAGNVYSATSVEELLERLWAVAASLEPCTFWLEEPIPAEDLQVFVDGEELAPCTDADCVEGWVYDEAEGKVQLAAASCRSLGGEACPDVVFESR